MCCLSDSQFGFRSGHCTSKWHSFLERRIRVGCIFIDLKKAFDSVPHQALLNKLSNLNLPPHLFASLSDYFNLCFQRVILGGYSSSWSPVTSGVPQGSILDPLLFLVYVNDIFDLHLSPNASLMVYADDILHSKPIATSSDLTALQSDLNLISDRLSNNLLTMNVNKTKLVIISRKRPSNPNSSLHPACVYISGSPLEVVKCFKYLHFASSTVFLP